MSKNSHKQIYNQLTQWLLTLKTKCNLNPSKIVEVSKNLGEAMVGLNIDDLDESEKLAKRGW